jgi:hypothetical protein
MFTNGTENERFHFKDRGCLGQSKEKIIPAMVRVAGFAAAVSRILKTEIFLRC